MKLLITGGCGFIGHHVVEHFIKNSDAEIAVLDKLTYAANGFDRLRSINVFDDKRVRTYTCDLTKELSVGLLSELKDTDYVLHLAAETHVDNSIRSPKDFVMSNVVGTFNLLEFARKLEKLKGFLYFSTDEVFGPAPQGVAYKEWDRYDSTNPYSATKAGGEELTLAWGNSYSLPVFITHTMNCFGERQHPEKFIPLVIRKVLEKERILIHADKTCTIPGCRSYIHCRNVAAGMHFLLDKFKQREKYNLVGEREIDNLSLVKLIASIMDMPVDYELVDFHSSRPGHDLRYMLDGKRMEFLGWELPVDFEASLERMINWSLNHKEWIYGGK